MTPELAALVEKVARAIFAKSDLYPILGWDDVGELTREMWRADALAAIRCIAEATREPTLTMEAAGNDEVMRQYEAHDWDDAKDMAENMDGTECYRRMHAASVLGEALRDD